MSRASSPRAEGRSVRAAAFALAPVLVLVASAPAATAQDKQADIALKPVSIQYDRSELQTRGDQKRLLLSGNVMATQGDLAIRADRVEATYASAPAAIASVIAEGNVTVNSGETLGRADKAEFDNAARTVTLSGNPMVLDQGIVLEADAITLHVDESRVVCQRCSIELDPSRVQLDSVLEKGAASP